VEFTVTDLCGNPSTTEATFTLQDTTPPALTCPAPLELDCENPLNDVLIDGWLSLASGSDECATDLTVTNDYPGTMTDGCGTTGVSTITFIITDACGNADTCMSTITIADNDGPIIEIPAQDLMVECDGAGNIADSSAWAILNGNAIASDNCSGIETWSYVTIPNDATCPNISVTTFIFTVTDSCGNISTTNADFIIIDETAPMLTPPNDTIVDCDGAGNTADLADWLARVGATDICDPDPTTDFSIINTISGCGGSNEVVYEFTAQDECGNLSRQNASFTIRDTTPPVISCPADLLLDCGNPNNDQIILSWLNSATATDICSDINITNTYPNALPANCGGSINIIFTATDACGNTDTCSANIMMQDTTPPSFVNCPMDLIVNVDVDLCSANPIFSTPLAEDNCGVTVTQITGPASGSSFPLDTTLIQFLAVDECGR
jgi:hypothetical protein